MHDPQRPRYVFLMRHAEHSAGHLTAEGTAHVRAAAGRFAEWLEGQDWQDGAARRIRLWIASDARGLSRATELLETADLFTQGVLTGVQHGQAEPNPFQDPHRDRGGPPERSAGREAWMAAALPGSLWPADAEQRVPSSYWTDRRDFEPLVQWLTRGNDAGGDERRSQYDAPFLIGNDPLIGWLASELTGRGVAVARGELACLVQLPGATRWRLIWTISATSIVPATVQ